MPCTVLCCAAFCSTAAGTFDDSFFAVSTSPCLQVKDRLRQLKLNAHAVSAKENERFKVNPPDSPWYIKLPYFALCIILDLVYEGRPIQRFWVLEEVARMPYFAYLSVLHLYESLGWWRAGAALRKVHFAEEWNELHHLQVRGDSCQHRRFRVV